MIVMNECFLANAGSKYGIDASLPLRLQKRALLKALGFPGNPKIELCLSCEASKVEYLFEKCSVQMHRFLIIVSEKPMSSLVPPLFVVNNPQNVEWRDSHGIKRIITASEVFSIFKDYKPNTWLEFSPYIFGEKTTVGRLMFQDCDHQILEVQQGTFLPKLMDNRELPTYMGEVSFLDIRRSGYLTDIRKLQDIGYSNVLPFATVRGILYQMPPLDNFERLCKIARFPTVEFAIPEDGQLFALKVDWPSQWVQKGG